MAGRREISRRKPEERRGTEPGGDEDQPFSFTVGDPGSLLGGITCKMETDGRQVK